MGRNNTDYSRNCLGTPRNAKLTNCNTVVLLGRLVTLGNSFGEILTAWTPCSFSNSSVQLTWRLIG